MWELCKGNVWESVKKSSRVCTQAGPRGWLTAVKLPKETHVWSMQRSWRVTPAGALQDKTFNLTKELALDLNSRLSQVARSSRKVKSPDHFVWEKLTFHIPNTHQYKYLLYPRIVKSFQREFWERNLKEKQDWLIHNLHPLVLQIPLLSPSPLLHPWEVHLAKPFSHHTHICERVIWYLGSN